MSLIIHILDDKVMLVIYNESMTSLMFVTLQLL